MFVPKIFLNKNLLIAHKEQVAAETESKIAASGLTREQLASQKQFAQHLTDELSIVLPTKKSHVQVSSYLLLVKPMLLMYKCVTCTHSTNIFGMPGGCKVTY